MADGDRVEVWGTYNSRSSAFSVNLKDIHGLYLIHVDFIPAEQTTVLNSKLSTRWDESIYSSFPDFRTGEQFKITLECRISEFRIFVNDKELSDSFLYGADLSSAVTVSLEGGSCGLTWDRVSLPEATSPKGIKTIQS